MSNTLERDQQSISYEPGRTAKISLPREHYYEYLDLVLNWEVEVLDADAERQGRGILDLIENVKVEYNGSKTPKSHSFAMGHYIDYYEYGSRPRLDRIDFDEEGEQDGYAQSFVQFVMEADSFDTPLPSFLFSTLDLEIKWADEEALAVDGSDHVEVKDAELKITSRERKRSAVDRESQVLDNLMVFKEKEIIQDVSNSGETKIELPRGNVYHSFPLLVIDDDSPTNDLVDHIEVVENGVDTHKSVDFDMQQNDDYQQYRIDDPVDGLAFPGYARGGDVDDAVDTSGMDSYHLILDTADNVPDDAYVQIVTRELIL